MKPAVWSSLLLCGFPSIALESGAQTPVGALAVDERQGDQWGWAVDYETATAAREAALRECGAACSVVLTFDRCGAYATDQDAGSTAAGWAEAYASADAAREAALAECRSRGGGSGCTVRAWGCNGPVIEEGLNLDRADPAADPAGSGGRELRHPARRTVCSVPGRVRRYGGGSRRAAPGRPGIWTVRRPRRCRRRTGRSAVRRRPLRRCRRPRRRPAQSWKACSGSRS